MTKRIKNIFYVLLGTFLLAVSVEWFIIPYDILSGGVAGIAVALEPFFHFEETQFANALVLIFLAVGYFLIGREFAARTALSSLAYPVFTTLLSRVDIGLTIDPMLCAFYAGLIGGAGIGLVMTTGASTGGMDVPSILMARLTKMKISTWVMIIDAATVLLGIIAYDINAALVGLIYVFASGYAIDKVLLIGQGNAKCVQIISEKYEAIRERIFIELNRGTTIINAKGGFTGDQKPMLMCVVAQRQYPALLNIISAVDASAFVITTDASEIHGEGFTYAAKE